MKQYKYTCELLLRNRFKKFTGEVEADTEALAKCKVYNLFSEKYCIKNPVAFEKSIKVEEVA